MSWVHSSALGSDEKTQQARDAADMVTASSGTAQVDRAAFVADFVRVSFDTLSSKVAAIREAYKTNPSLNWTAVTEKLYIADCVLWIYVMLDVVVRALTDGTGMVRPGDDSVVGSVHTAYDALGGMEGMVALSSNMVSGAAPALREKVRDVKVSAEDLGAVSRVFSERAVAKVNGFSDTNSPGLQQRDVAAFERFAEAYVRSISSNTFYRNLDVDAEVFNQCQHSAHVIVTISLLKKRELAYPDNYAQNLKTMCGTIKRSNSCRKCKPGVFATTNADDMMRFVSSMSAKVLAPPSPASTSVTDSDASSVVSDSDASSALSDSDASSVASDSDASSVASDSDASYVADEIPDVDDNEWDPSQSATASAMSNDAGLRDLFGPAAASGDVDPPISMYGMTTDVANKYFDVFLDTFDKLVTATLRENGSDVLVVSKLLGQVLSAAWIVASVRLVPRMDYTMAMRKLVTESGYVYPKDGKHMYSNPDYRKDLPDDRQRELEKAYAWHQRNIVRNVVNKHMAADGEVAKKASKCIQFVKTLAKEHVQQGMGAVIARKVVRQKLEEIEGEFVFPPATWTGSLGPLTPAHALLVTHLQFCRKTTHLEIPYFLRKGKRNYMYILLKEGAALVQAARDMAAPTIERFYAYAADRAQKYYRSGSDSETARKAIADLAGGGFEVATLRNAALAAFVFAMSLVPR